MVHNIIDQLYVGDDDGYSRVKDKEGWSFLRACKYGPGGHQQTLGYTTPGAPKGPNYLFVKKGNLLALNILDLEDPAMIPQELIDKGLNYIHERISAGDKVLVACNQGHSRSASIILAYLRAADGMGDSFIRAEKLFKHICPSYDPGTGMRSHVREMWRDLPNFFGGKNGSN